MSLPRYPEYKDSGIDWLGDVPAHWDVVPLKRSFQIVGGSTPKSDKSEYWDGSITWVSPADLSKLTSIYIDDSARKITEEGLASCGTTLVPSGSIVLSTRAPIGSLAIAAKSLCTNQGCKALVPNHGVGSLYFAYLLLAATDELNIRGRGTTFLELSSDELGAFKATVPSCEEQTTIATFLDHETGKIDSLIAEQEQLIALLAEKRQATISHAVTKGLNPDAPMKDSGVAWLGEVPRHWTVMQIRYFAEILRGKFTHRPRNDPAFYDGEYPFVQTGDITSAERYITTYKQTLNKRGADVSKEFPKGTLVMAIAANIGDVAILDFPAYFPDSIVGLVPKQGVNLLFMFYLMLAMKSPMIQNATISTQMNLNVDQISSLIAGCPPALEQVAIVSFLDNETSKIDALQAESEHAIDLLKERRSALIAAAVTGQIDVRGIVTELEAA